MPDPNQPGQENAKPQRQLLAETGILSKQFTLTDQAKAVIYQGNRMTEYRLESTEGHRLHWSRGERGTLTTTRGTFQLSEANLFFSPHNEPISFYKEPTPNAEVFVLLFDPDLSLPDSRRIFTTSDPIFVYAESLKHALLNGETQHQIRGLANLVKQELEENQFKDNRTAEACDHLAANLQNPHAVEDLPELLSLSGSQMRRIFKQELGSNPTEWHLAARLSFAHYLLKGTDLPFQTVAAKCGFASYPTFSRLFKAEYDYSPKDARLR